MRLSLRQSIDITSMSVTAFTRSAVAQIDTNNLKHSRELVTREKNASGAHVTYRSVRVRSNDDVIAISRADDNA